MYRAGLSDRASFPAWRDAARPAISNRIPPGAIDWTGTDSLFDTTPLPGPGPHKVTVPPDFL
ncbi:MAG: uracil-DNA glycosylase, partial [Pseudorhodobacter sp.]|nr:uracil-DNA glycosylase [Pseudorhodobacter sp.]